MCQSCFLKKPAFSHIFILHRLDNMFIMNDKFYITQQKAFMLCSRTGLDISRNIATIVRIFLGSRTRKYEASYYVNHSLCKKNTTYFARNFIY